MKFAATALLALQSAAAFTGPAAPKSSSALNSFYAPGSDVGVSSYTGGPAGSLRTSGPISRESVSVRNDDVWDSEITVQGGSLRTWSFPDANVDRVQVFMRTEGRPLNANVELWQGPDNTPQKMGVYCEDASLRPFSAVVETPRDSNAIAIRNTGHIEFPLTASVQAEGDRIPGGGVGPVQERISDLRMMQTIQGGAIVTYPFSAGVQSVQVLLRTDGRPLNSRIELLQGPNNNKQVLEIYTEDGMERPFYAVIETPGVGNVIRIVNTATVEFPLAAAVEPYMVEPGYSEPPKASRLADSGNYFFLDR